MAIFRDILFELYEGDGRKRLRTLDGQGVKVLHIRSPHTDRDTWAPGTVFKADLSLHSSGSYYQFAYPQTLLGDCYFADSREDPKVKEFMVTKGSAEAPKATAPIKKFNIPEVPSRLKISAKTWRLLNGALSIGRYPFLIGPKGCGKSETAKCLAEANGLEFFEFDLGQAFKPKAFFLGTMIVGESGKTEQVRSEFFKAFTSDKPTLIFLDEITRTPLASANYLMTVLSRNQSFIYDTDSGTRYNKGEHVTICAAGNAGYAYMGTQRLDSAFEDRFIKIPVTYMSDSDEIQLIQQRVPECAFAQASQIVAAANKLRAAEEKGTLQTSMSTRQVLDAAAYVGIGFSVAEAINDVILTNYILSGELDKARTIIQGM